MAYHDDIFAKYFYRSLGRIPIKCSYYLSISLLNAETYLLPMCLSVNDIGRNNLIWTSELECFIPKLKDQAR